MSTYWYRYWMKGHSEKWEKGSIRGVGLYQKVAIIIAILKHKTRGNILSPWDVAVLYCRQWRTQGGCTGCTCIPPPPPVHPPPRPCASPPLPSLKGWLWENIRQWATRKKSDITAFFGRAAKPTAVAADANPNNQSCGAETIFLGSGSGSYFWKVMVPVPTFEKVMVPVPIFEKLRLRFRFQLHIQTVKSKFFNFFCLF